MVAGVEKWENNMFTAKDLVDFENTRVKVTCKDGCSLIGDILLVTWAEDSDDGRDSIDIETDDGQIYCIYDDEIAYVEGLTDIRC